MKNFKKLISTALAFIFILAVLPVSGTAATYNYLFPVSGGKLAYYYGYTAEYGGDHKGIDIHAVNSNIIYAAYDGYVEVATDPCPHISWAKDHTTDCGHYSTFGNSIIVKQDDGKYAYYGHLKQGSLIVKAGDRVTKGQPMAIMGSAGYSTGLHLHFEVRNSRTSGDTINVNPTSYPGGTVTYSYAPYGGLDVDYTSIAEGDYYIKNLTTGKYLSVDGDANTVFQNISVLPITGGEGQKFHIFPADNGYKLMPLCTYNKIVNPYATLVANGTNINLYFDNSDSSQWWGFEAVSGGYILRNIQNPKCVLSTDGSNAFTETELISANQNWALIPVTELNASDVFVFKLNNKAVLSANQNTKITIDAEAKYEKGKTLVPLRAISAAIGLDDLKFNSADSTITFTGFDGYKVEMTLNSTLCTITKGAEVINASVAAPVTIGGVTMLPLRDTAFLTGGCVKYDNSGYVVVSSKEIPDSDIPGYIAAYNAV